MQKRDLIQANASLENLRQNLDMKDFAKEILLEENYNKPKLFTEQYLKR